MWIKRKDYDALQEKLRRTQAKLDGLSSLYSVAPDAASYWVDSLGNGVLTMRVDVYNQWINKAVDERLRDLGMNKEGKAILWYKKKSRWAQVLGTTYDSNGYPQFIVYDDGQWRRISAKHFRPAPDDVKSEDKIGV